MDGQLDGRRVVVTGAATGVGAGAVTALVREGARVAAIHHSSPPPDELVDVARWWRCDLRRKDAVDEVFAEISRELDGFDVLVHCAGLWVPSTPEDLSEEDLDSLFATNVKATVFTNQAAFAHLRARGGAIVNVGSCEGVTGSPISASYASTKAAVHAWTRSAARAWGRYGITVNTLAPAAETPGADRFREFLGPDAAARIDKAASRSIVIGGHLGDPADDVGPAIAFLASTAAHFMTGQLVAVDGGVMMVGA
jgi:NAD(P)-dependent dehydrogenase (short-subunit alcohol dehydrogenase family)